MTSKAFPAPVEHRIWGHLPSGDPVEHFTLTGADGGEVVLGKDHLMVEASHHRVILPPVGADSFTARWRAMSEDGHILKGEFSFRVGAD